MISLVLCVVESLCQLLLVLRCGLVAARMFLQRLEMREIRELVASACNSLSWVEQPKPIEDKPLAEELCTMEVEDDAAIEQPHANVLACAFGLDWRGIGHGDVSDDTDRADPIVA